MKKITSIIILLFFIIIATKAQSISRSVIGNSGTSNNIEWTVGELMVRNYDINNTAISQGFHQGKLIITDVSETENNLIIKIYPNPTTSYLILETEYSDQLSYKLYNLVGQLVIENNLTNPYDRINVEQLVSGIYLLQIFKHTKPIKTFKIHKTD